MPGLTDTLARRALERSVADRHTAYVTEVERIVDATYRLIERTGGVDPSVRDVLAEAGLSTQAFYRYFKSKDELMLALLDDGRRRLLGYLEHRMGTARSPAAKVRAWVEGVLAQASRADAAARTRPFVANQDRLAEAFPAEQRESIDLLVALLIDPIMELQRDAGNRRAEPRRREAARHAAEAVYMLAFGTMHTHLARRTRPTAQEADDLVAFALRGIGAPITTAAGESHSSARKTRARRSG